MSGWVPVFHRYLHVAGVRTTSADHSGQQELTRYRMVCISGWLTSLVFEFTPLPLFGPGPKSVIDTFFKVNGFKSLIEKLLADTSQYFPDISTLRAFA